MDPCLEDLGSRYVGTWYARMQTYPSYGCVRAGIDTNQVQYKSGTIGIRLYGTEMNPGISVF